MFYFRDAELARLKKIYDSPTKSAIAIYGRPRTGKSALILESFRRSKDVPSFYFLCGSGTYNAVLSQFVFEFSSFLQIDQTILPPFLNFRQAFAFFIPRLQGKKLLLAIDEFPSLSRKQEDKETASEFNEIIEKEMRGSQLSLILCGSNVRFMNYVVSNADSPLHGRFQETILLQPFTYQETAQICAHFLPFEQLAIYGATGGVAEYVFRFASYPSFRKAVESLYLTPGGRLYSEAIDLLNFEFENASTYQSILSFVGAQRKRPADIAKAIGIEPNAFYYFGNVLSSVGILSDYKTAFPEKQRDTTFFIADPFFRFYYGFIAQWRSKIAYLDPSLVYQLAFSDEKLHAYLGHIYEEAVVKGLLYQASLKGSLPFVPEDVLPWVGKIPNASGDWGETEIDLCLFDAHHVILGECKAKKKKLSLAIYNELLEKSAYVHCGKRDKAFLLASFSGFEDEVLMLKKNGVFLISGSDIL
jgi:AAA+ ATPase superfamily predicted ATPase